MRFKEQTSNPNAPISYQTPDGYKLGSWQGWQRKNYRKGKLDSERIKKLEDIGFIWGKHDTAFEEGFQETLRFKEQTSNPNAPVSYQTPDGYKLGSWQGWQRKNYRKGKLDIENIKRLEDIGFIWNKLDELFNRGLQETLKYKEQTGDANAPQSYKTPDGFNLGSWQGTQKHNFKNSKLNAKRIKRLKEIGFKWVLLEDTFEKGFQETLRYKEQTGDANAPVCYQTPDGFILGDWQSKQRQNYKNGKLDTERIKRLEEIGFKRNLYEGLFEKGFQETLKYREETGNPNAPVNFTTLEKYNLGNWQSKQRKDFKNGKLYIEKIKCLEEIGFQWVRIVATFEKGIQETLKYKQQTGDSNAPFEYTTPDGYNLGSWQSRQRQYYKKGKLSHERKKRLDQIGVKWDLLEESFEKGFQETLRYKEQIGDANATWNYKTSDGFKLESWQYIQRRNYKNGKLDSERIKRLEGIGFKWKKKKSP
ncbi:MAG: helicase associated domain-containing protein [Nitrospirae bacterium]|nr:helicase associated domain-containing protein [Nitrospirota bacterium]